MGRGHLDPKILDKIAAKVGKERRAVSVMVSKKAAKLGISSEAALVIIAKEHGIGTAWFQRKLDLGKQAEVQASLPLVFAEPVRQEAKGARKRPTKKLAVAKRGGPVKLAVRYLLQDPELVDRCEDLLVARGNYDRAINQGTLLLEDRIRTKGQPTKSLVGESLVGHLLNADPKHTVIKISNNADEQRGFAGIVRGMFPAFRNVTHHHVTKKFTQQDALRICGFIDVLLGVIDRSTKVKEV